MKKKTVMICGLFGASAVLLGLLGSAGAFEALLVPALASASGPAIGFSSTKNLLYSGASSGVGNATVTSNAGTAISFAYSGLASSDSNWQAIAQDGYFTNADAIHGMTAIGIQLTSGSLKIYYSASTSFTETNSYTYSTSTSTFDFASTYPNYLKVVALEASVIRSVSLSFDCSEHHVLGSSFSLGKYPQTVVEDSATLDALASATDPDSDGYLEYGSDEYKKVTASPYASSYPSASGSTTFTTGSTYYFKVEPIQWRVLSGVGTSSGLLLAPKILDKGPVYCLESAYRTIDGARVYANNYKYSSLRAYLNGIDGGGYSAGNYAGVGFLNKAFTSAEQNWIVSASVDNSAATTDNSTNSYASADTTDKIFALSYQDTLNTNYGFSGSSSMDSTRQVVVSDYARAIGAYMFTGAYYGMSEWLTRSPLSSDNGKVSSVEASGALGSKDSISTNCDILPALRVNLA